MITGLFGLSLSAASELRDGVPGIAFFVVVDALLDKDGRARVFIGLSVCGSKKRKTAANHPACRTRIESPFTGI